MATITIPITKELEVFISNEMKNGGSKAQVVRNALMRMREERALEHLREAERDITEGRVYKGDLKKLLSKMK